MMDGVLATVACRAAHFRIHKTLLLRDESAPASSVSSVMLRRHTVPGNIINK